jgi:hypothetical protein
MRWFGPLLLKSLEDLQGDPRSKAATPKLLQRTRPSAVAQLRAEHGRRMSGRGLRLGL